MNVNIEDYGAKGDGVYCNTREIAAAIDACHKSGGGTVTVPAGVFVTGTIRLLSHVELHLASGAILRATERREEYNTLDEYPENFECVSEGWGAEHLILAVRQEDVRLSGSGVIDGNGERFCGGELRHISNYFWKKGYYTKEEGAPLRLGQMVVFVDCRRVTVTDVTLRNSCSWNLFLHGCDDVKVRGIRVKNDEKRANTDGIDIDCCRYVTVSDATIDTGDDCIAIRAAANRLTRKQACEYITVSNCVLSNSACAVRIGVGEGEIHHVNLSDLVLAKSGEGITLQTGFCGRGSVHISDVCVGNILGDDVGFPLQVLAYENRIERVSVHDYKTHCTNKIVLAGESGYISDFTIRNTEVYDKVAELPVPELARKERGDEIVSVRGVRRLSLEHVRVHLRKDYFKEREKMIRTADSTVLENDIRFYSFEGDELSRPVVL